MKLKQFTFRIKIGDDKKSYYRIEKVFSTYLGGAVRKWQQNNRISGATIVGIVGDTVWVTK